MPTALEQLEKKIDRLTEEFLDVLSDPQQTVEDGQVLLRAVHAAEDEQRELRRQVGRDALSQS